MNNEPVAKVTENGIYLEYPLGLNLKVGTKLYTHPVKEQDESFDRTASHMAGEYVSYKVELTDEEIYRLLADSIWAVGLNTDCLDEQNWADGITVARAILRKASEK